MRTDGDFFAEDAQKLVDDTKKYHASYPVDETKGDKNTGGSSDSKDGGGKDGGSDDSSTMSE